ncbi:hypothetical protein GGF32_008396 [Allomyces javanicus]|nr:hypothetical protein GGF32_008396 [Allomyces javanicus]
MDDGVGTSLLHFARVARVTYAPAIRAMISVSSVHWLHAHDYDASIKTAQFRDRPPRKAILNVGRLVETTQQPRLLLILGCEGDIVTEEDSKFSVSMDAIVSLRLSAHLPVTLNPPEHPAVLPLFRGLSAHGISLRSLAISSVTLATLTITVLTSALGPDLIDLELQVVDSMEAMILERITTRCPNVRTLALSQPNERFMSMESVDRPLQQFARLEELTLNRPVNEADVAVAATIKRCRRPGHTPNTVPLRRLTVTGRMDMESLAPSDQLQHMAPFRQPASKIDDSGLKLYILPALRSAGHHLTVLHLDALIHSKAVLAMLVAALPRMTALRDLRIASSDMFQGASADVCAPFARAIPPRVRLLVLAECTVDEDGLHAFVVESNVATRRVIAIESVLPWMWDEARTVAQDVEAVDAMMPARQAAGTSGIVDVFVGARAKRYCKIRRGDAVAAAIQRPHLWGQPNVVPLRRLCVTGRRPRQESTFWTQPLAGFRPPAAQSDDGGLNFQVLPALQASGQRIAMLHLDALIHSQSILVKLFALLPHMTALRDLRITSIDMFQGASTDVCAPFARAIPPHVRYVALAECTVDEDGLRALVIESNVATRRVIAVGSVIPWMWDEARTEEQDAEAVNVMVQQRHTAGKSGVMDVFVGMRATRYWL